jgi:hypothetical protein
MRARKTCDWLQVVQQIVPQRIHRAIDDMRAPVADAESVSVGRRVNCTANTDATASPGDVLDDDWLIEALAHGSSNGASDRVRGAAGRERDDECDPMDRVFCRNSGRAKRDRNHCSGE